jgi:CRISPR-associated protein Cas5
MNSILQEIDISILKKTPILGSIVTLEIQPLAPLSMVSELPGSYYKTLKLPDNKMLCGLFENILGWHIDLADRKKIFEEIESLYKQAKPKKGQTKTPDLFGFSKETIQRVNHSKGSTYLPLLMDFFEIKEVNPRITEVTFYDDLWSRAYRRSDSHKHVNGTRWMDSSFISKWDKIKELVDMDTKRKSNEKNTLLDNLFKRYSDKFPLYYSTPTMREYISMKGKYEIILSIDSELNTMLQKKILTDNTGYLGNSEGWVDLKFI